MNIMGMKDRCNSFLLFWGFVNMVAVKNSGGTHLVIMCTNLQLIVLPVQLIQSASAISSYLAVIGRTSVPDRGPMYVENSCHHSIVPDVGHNPPPM